MTATTMEETMEDEATAEIRRRMLDAISHCSMHNTTLDRIDARLERLEGHAAKTAESMAKTAEAAALAVQVGVAIRPLLTWKAAAVGIGAFLASGILVLAVVLVLLGETDALVRLAGVAAPG